jgi:hypothetical protein
MGKNGGWPRELVIVDMFCGAGGTGQGIKETLEELGLKARMFAINHWEVAVNTHARNIPEAEHICEPVEKVDPLRLIPDGKSEGGSTMKYTARLITESETMSLSKHLETNGKREKCHDKAGKLLEEAVITADGYIHRFRAGLLDGSTEKDGITITQPAVEGPGHLEYWRAGNLHRDEGLPAVISDGLKKREWWVNGEFVRKDY